MLKIRPLARYRVPKYPQGPYRDHQTHPAVQAVRQGAVSALLLALLDCSGDSGTTGPPPVVPTLVTEAEAREVIDNVFAANAISLTPDFKLKLKLNAQDSVEVELDGFNDSLAVGYEYIYEADNNEFTSAVRSYLESSAFEAGPQVKTVEAVERESNYQEYLQQVMQEFIDSLKTQGII